jgi:hypothetical protein
VSLTQPSARGARRLRRGVAAALIIAAAPVLAACAAGGDAQSLQVKPNLAATSVGTTLQLNGVTVVTTASGSAPAALNANINNTGGTAETLQSVTIGGSPVTFSGAGGAGVTDVTIPAGGSVIIGGQGNAQAVVNSLPVQAGQYTQVVFQFANAGQVTLNALVNTATGIYASNGPAVPPSPSATPTGTVSGKPVKPGTSAGATTSTTAKPGATASGTAKATASPTH